MLLEIEIRQYALAKILRSWKIKACGLKEITEYSGFLNIYPSLQHATLIIAEDESELVIIHRFTLYYLHILGKLKREDAGKSLSVGQRNSNRCITLTLISLPMNRNW